MKQTAERSPAITNALEVTASQSNLVQRRKLGELLVLGCHFLSQLASVMKLTWGWVSQCGIAHSSKNRSVGLATEGLKLRLPDMSLRRRALPLGSWELSS